MISVHGRGFLLYLKRNLRHPDGSKTQRHLMGENRRLTHC